MLEEVAAECAAHGGSVEALTGDVGERAFVESMAARAVERFGRIDVVVNNAGISKHKQIYHVTARRRGRGAARELPRAGLPHAGRAPRDAAAGRGLDRQHLVGGGQAAAAARDASMRRPSSRSPGSPKVSGSTSPGSGIHAAGHPRRRHRHRDLAQDRRADRLSRPQAAARAPSSAAVFRAIERRRHEVWVPATLRLAWWLRLLAPGRLSLGRSALRSGSRRR